MNDTVLKLKDSKINWKSFLALKAASDCIQRNQWVARYEFSNSALLTISVYLIPFSSKLVSKIDRKLVVLTI